MIYITPLGQRTSSPIIQESPGRHQRCGVLAGAHLGVHRAKETQRRGTSELVRPLKNLEWPSSHCQSLTQDHNYILCQLILLPFLSLEKIPHLRNHWGCFLKMPVWQGDRGHHSAFSLIWRDRVKLKRGSSAPSPKTLSIPLSLGGLPRSVLRPPLSVWHQQHCKRLTKNRKPGGQRGRPEGRLNQARCDGCSSGPRSPEDTANKTAPCILFCTFLPSSSSSLCLYSSQHSTKRCPLSWMSPRCLVTSQSAWMSTRWCISTSKNYFTYVFFFLHFAWKKKKKKKKQKMFLSLKTTLIFKRRRIVMKRQQGGCATSHTTSSCSTTLHPGSMCMSSSVSSQQHTFICKGATATVHTWQKTHGTYWKVLWTYRVRLSVDPINVCPIWSSPTNWTFQDLRIIIFWTCEYVNSLMWITPPDSLVSSQLSLASQQLWVSGWEQDVGERGVVLGGGGVHDRHGDPCVWEAVQTWQGWVYWL